MKRLKKLSIVLFSVILFNCGNDNDALPVALDDTPTVSINIASAITLPPNSDITNLVTLNGQVASDYISELEIGKKLTLAAPGQAKSAFEVKYTGLEVFKDQGKDILVQFEPLINGDFLSIDGNLKLVLPPGQFNLEYYGFSEDVPTLVVEASDASTTSVLEYSYNLIVNIYEGATVYGPYIIDPKIRIKRRN